jgi:SAM-dependent methyltransferase
MTRLSVSEQELNRTLSPRDGMFAGDPAHYFAVGASALAGIGTCLEAAGLAVPVVRRVLDLPCGHGRVLRHLRAAFPKAEVTACDTDRDGVDFCTATFQAAGVYSVADPGRIAVAQGAYDLVFVGSLLTHLDADRWHGFLTAFRNFLRPGGLLVFTTHGRLSHHWLTTGHCDYGIPQSSAAVVRQYRKTGFGFARYPGAKDAYGISVSHPSWVLNQLARIGEMRIVHFIEKGWDQHQDCYGCVREAGW